MDSSEESPLKFKVMKRGLRVTSTDPPTEVTLDFRLWDAIDAASVGQAIHSSPSASRAHSRGLLTRSWGLLGARRPIDGFKHPRRSVPISDFIYSLSALGERVKAQMPPPPPLADRPPPLKSKVRKVHIPKLDLRDIEILRSWPAEVVQAIPAGGKECVEDTWARPVGLLRLAKLFQLGMVEVGVVHIAWDAQTDRIIPTSGKAPRTVWRRTAAAKLAFS